MVITEKIDIEEFEINWLGCGFEVLQHYCVGRPMFQQLIGALTHLKCSFICVILDY